jgi:anti-sigma B factor antagonist
MAQAPARPDGANGRHEVIVLAEEIDVTNSPAACTELCDAIYAGAGVVIADMTATRYCDSSAMRALLVAHDQAAASNSQLRVVIPAETPMMRALALIGLDQVLSIYPSVQEALNAAQ